MRDRWDLGLGAVGLFVGVSMFVLAWPEGSARAVPQPSQSGGPVTPACGGVPPADTLLGQAGSMACYVRGDAARPTVVQAANVTTDASGNWSVTWAKPWSSANPVVVPLPQNSGSMPIVCNWSTRSATAASGKCWQALPMTLPATATALLGLVLNPFDNAAAGITITVIARETTQ